MSATARPFRRWDACTGDPCTCPKPIQAWREKNATPILRVVGAVMEERRRQDEKWGEQNHEDGTGPHVVWTFTGTAEWIRDCAKATTDDAHDLGNVTWQDILFEEVAEAFAEDDPAKLRTELVQIAAVAVQWIQAIDRRAATRGSDG